jgi:hypothetical protein
MAPKEDSMRLCSRALVTLLVLIAGAASVLAASKSQPQFDRIKSLAGTWVGKGADGRPVHIHYKLVSGGSVVMESIFEKADEEMITLYHLDGDHLMMTHYCTAHNQPRMRADPAGADPNTIKFKFVDATNLASPNAGHMHAHAITWKDSDHVAQQWTWRENGKERVETFDLVRQK